ncbi:MAG: aspartate aminotransferase family protein [archaeon]|nr:aspartate aminotransferase family protein [archaeon]
MQEENKIIGSESQKSLVKYYSDHVNKPKADFFRSVGLGVIQGTRNGIYLNSLEGPRRKKPPYNLIDCRTSGGVFNLGHRNPEIIKALKEAIDAGLDIGDHHMLSEQRSLLAKELATLMPGDISQTQFCVCGGEAIDLAIKLARAATKRTKVISAIGGYHGVTGLALGAGDPKFKDIFLWNPPGFSQVEFGNIESLKKIIDEDTACVIYETIPATAGILIPPEGFFAEVRELCDEKGVIMIQDEVQTGLGRTGKMWGIYGGLYDEEKIVPDIIVLAKGMSGGYYPLATTSYKPFLGEVFEEDPFLHISTTGGSEIGCYVTRKVLDIQSKPTFLERVIDMGNKLGNGLSDLKEKFPSIVTQVRGRGLMWGIEFIADRYGLGYTLRMIENGIFADYCGNNEKTVKLMPPLITKEEEIDEILTRLGTAMATLPKPS